MYRVVTQTLFRKGIKISLLTTTVHAKDGTKLYFKTASSLFDKMESKEDLKKRLTPMQYHVTQEAGTERPFTGCYNKFYESGTYVCVVCKQELFSSDTKFDSGCGWPAFNDVLAQEKVTLHKDTSTGMVRTEVRCAKCSAHLGHVFGDGPAPTKKRYCINSASVDFIYDKDQEKQKNDS